MSNLEHMKIATATKTIAGFLSLIIGRKARIVWGKSAACDEGGVFYLPRPKTGEPDEVALLTRQAVHEAGHNAYTDFSAMDGIDANIQTIFNTLEDPRIEAEQMKQFKGASLILNRGLDSAYKSLMSKLDPTVEDDQAMILAVAILTRGYLAVAPHRAIGEHGPQFLERFEPALSEKTLQAVKSATEQLSGCTSSADVISLSHALWAAMQVPEKLEEPEQAQEPSTPPEGENAPKKPENAQGEPDGGKVDQSTEPEASEPDEVDAADGKEDAGQPAEQAGESESNAEQAPQSDADTAPQGGDQQDGGDDAGGQPEAAEDEASGAAKSEQDGPDQTPEGQPSQSGAQGPIVPDGDASQDTAQNPAQEGGQGQPSSVSAVEAGSQGHPSEQGQQLMDLSSLKGFDLGELLAQAYADQFGEPDVEAQLGVADQETVSDDNLAQLIAQAMQEAEDKGEPLETVLAAVQEAIADQEAGESSPAPALAAGGGNGSGQKVQMDLGVRLSGLLSKLVRVFTKELQDKRRRPLKYGQAGGQVAGNRIWRLKHLGDTNVFRIRKPMSGIDAAVTILLDRSASMTPDIVAAAEVSVACAQALERISKVKTSIEMFPGYELFTEATTSLQAFGEPARQAVKRLPEIDAAGGTPLAEALREVLPRLLKQRTQKHLVILVTDGMPNNPDEVRVLMTQAQAQGVEFMGIGMGGHCQIERLLPYSIHIDEASELPDGLEKLFSGRLAERLAA